MPLPAMGTHDFCDCLLKRMLDVPNKFVHFSFLRCTASKRDLGRTQQVEIRPERMQADGLPADFLALQGIDLESGRNLVVAFGQGPWEKPTGSNKL